MTHKCAICSKNKDTIGASSVLIWLGLIPAGAKGYAHKACLKKARADRLAAKGKAPKTGKAPTQAKTAKPLPAIPSVALSLPPLPPRKPLPPKVNGWTVRYDELGLIHAAKKGKEPAVFPNVTRMYDGLREG